MLLPGCGLRSWHMVQKERCADSPQTPLSACRGGVPPPPPTSVTGPPARDGAVAVVISLTTTTTVARAKAVRAPPRTTQVVRCWKRPFFSELNFAPLASDDCVFPVSSRTIARPDGGVAHVRCRIGGHPEKQRHAFVGIRERRPALQLQPQSSSSARSRCFAPAGGRGTPFEVEAIGLERHHVFVSEQEVVFFFEGGNAATVVTALLRSPEVLKTAVRWRRILAGPPRLAEERFGWAVMS
jgi:hypothetical protein